MLLIEIALYIFLFTFIIFISARVLWIVFFLFCYRFWEIIFNTHFEDFISNLTNLEKFFFLFLVALLTYLIIHFSTMKFIVLRYIFLIALMLYTLRMYSFSDILFFKDYFVEKGWWDLNFWFEQIRKSFTLSPEEIMNVFNKILNNIVNFFVKIIDFVRSL